MKSRLTLLAAMLVLASSQLSAQAVDLSDTRQLLDAYVKTVGDTSGEEVVLYAQSTVFAFMPGQRGQPILGMEIVGVKRYERIEGGWQRVQREIAFYTDLETGEILTHWENPWLQREVRVLPVLNDPVNRRHVIDEQGGGWGISYMEAGDDIIFHREVPLRYRNPLPFADYPLHSRGDWYEAMELFNNFVRRSDLEDPNLTSAPSTGSWSRIGPWLPWMELGNREGWLVYHGRAVKVAGVEDLPAHVLEAIRRDYPKYLRAPEAWSEPSETSWTFFKKVLDGDIDPDNMQDH
ncbi:MAG: DUF1838 family protein [Gammaproteobacteria bacterium]|nr:DUF1838 family protein [Gammaproteobacteria bacterium]